MPREKEDFRPVYTVLLEKFPGKDTISLRKAAEYLDCDQRTLANDETFPWIWVGKKRVVSLVRFARWIAA